MDPVTAIAVGGMAASAIGGVVSAVGSEQSGNAQKSMYDYQAGITSLNAQVSKQNASYALATGEVEAQQSGMQTRAQIGETKAIQGASGLDVNSGSGATVRSSEADIGAENQAVIRSNAAKRAYGYEVEATQATAQGQVDVMAGQNAQSAGQIGAISSILGGASSVSSKWLQANQQGIPGFVS